MKLLGSWSKVSDLLVYFRPKSVKLMQFWAGLWKSSHCTHPVTNSIWIWSCKQWQATPVLRALATKHFTTSTRTTHTKKLHTRLTWHIHNPYWKKKIPLVIIIVFIHPLLLSYILSDVQLKSNTIKGRYLTTGQMSQVEGVIPHRLHLLNQIYFSFLI